MNNKIKVIIIAVVLAIIMLASIIVLSNTDTDSIEVGDDVYVVNTSIDESTIIGGTVIEIKYQDNEIVEYAVLLPQVVNSVAIYSVVIYSPVNIFLTHKQALKYALSN